jgi:hypothetical protein
MSGKLNLASSIGDKLLSKLMKQEQGLAPFLEELYQKEVKSLWKEFVQDGQRQGTIEPDLSVEALLIYLQVLKDGFSAHPKLVEARGRIWNCCSSLARSCFTDFCAGMRSCLICSSPKQSANRLYFYIAQENCQGTCDSER